MLNYPAWKNGKYCKVQDLNVSILDLGLIHCDATYDVIAVKNAEIQNLDAHINRFFLSANGWRIPVNYSMEDIKIVLETLVASAPTDDLLLWVGLTRGIPTSGNPRDLKNCTPNIFAYAKPYFGFNPANEATVCLARNVKRIPESSVKQANKNFAWNDLTMAQWEAIDRGYDTAILCSVDGYITEGVGFNVGFISKDGFVYAPKHNRLEGTVMKQVEQICNENGVNFMWADISPIDIYQEVDAMFLTSTAGNVIKVKQFEDMIFEENETLSWLQSKF
jgi:branched-subunit amino acid aminotransferase/4-amino-4-deoxychorismate lyase